MRTTVPIDDLLFEKALEVADPETGTADLASEAIKIFVRVQAGKRLAALGSVAPQVPEIIRPRGESASSCNAAWMQGVLVETSGWGNHIQ